MVKKISLKANTQLLLLLSFFVVWSCDDIVGIEDISDNEVTVIAPLEDSVLSTLTPNFSWEPVTGADVYQLQIAEPSFEAATQVVLDTTITHTNFIQSLDSGVYQWRIRAKNTEYQTPYSIQSFSIE